MIVGSYVLHLYCDNTKHCIAPAGRWAGHNEFTGATEDIAFAFARQAGWDAHKLKTKVRCPLCVKHRINLVDSGGQKRV